MKKMNSEDRDFCIIMLMLVSCSFTIMSILVFWVPIIIEAILFYWRPLSLLSPLILLAITLVLYFGLNPPQKKE